MITILLVMLADDDYLFLECIENVISSDFDDFRIVGRVVGASEMMRKVHELDPDVVIIMTSADDDSDITATETLYEQFPNSKVVVLSTSEDADTLSRLVQAGVSAYLLRKCSIKELAESILAVASGTNVLTPSMVGKLMETFRKQSKKVHTEDSFSLSEREKEILQFAAAGASNRDIAKKCRIKETTVKSHFRNILGKMEVRNRAGAVALASSKGLLTHIQMELPYEDDDLI
jgi:DNA-binding NarL/FixJ family response regulator